MYQERLFTTWKIGLLHLAIVVVMPVIPVIIYLLTEGTGKAYLYALILTVVVSLLYEYMNSTYKNCGKFLKIEGFICSAVLIVMLMGSVFLLFLSFSTADGHSNGIDIRFWSILLVTLFSVPIIATSVEIIRCLKYDLNSGAYLPDKENLVKGAANV